jgi:phosphonoacetaldehyde hydrolase
MTSAYAPRFHRHLQAVILDWAGTTVDYGSHAPLEAIIKVFEGKGVQVKAEEVREPMGQHKRDHLKALTEMPAIIKRWEKAHDRTPHDDDVEELYEAFSEKLKQTIIENGTLIPGVKEAVDALRTRGLQIGSSTGYVREVMQDLLPTIEEQGYKPDTLVCVDEVSGGRPAPWMIFQNAMLLDVYPMFTVVKIGDTVADVLAGLNAGTWTIGIAKTGNALGLREDEIAELEEERLASRLTAARRKLYQAGAHYVVDSLADVMPVIERIDKRLMRGETP